jgi:hypothetical protein
MTRNQLTLAGFVLGLVLSGLSVVLAGIGHGTYAPMLANLSVFLFIPVVGIPLAVFGVPFLWAFYFRFIHQHHRSHSQDREA